MLRGLLLGTSVVLLALAIAATAIGWAAWPTVLFAGLLFVGVAFERVHYRGSASVDSPGKDWRATNERFLDEATGRPVTVWFNPTTGERRYVDE